mmetsp:Transcript_44285/g.137927  ORF Transcript_44285/g.137927 Transcript_44285/m.137927 type:complete len:724 (+) Transcript_44285:75-2246(+)
MAEGGGTPRGRKFIRVRMALSHFTFRMRMKSFLLYTCYFLTYYVHYSLESDWEFAGTTLRIYRMAEAERDGMKSWDDPWCHRGSRHSTLSGQRCWWRWRESARMDHLLAYIEDRISTLPGHLQSYCPDCLVGITKEHTSMKKTSLAAFACADFDSTVGTNDYPPRDCATADAAWARFPTPTEAPCCGNHTLVMASIMMMARSHERGETHMPLEVLVHQGKDEAALKAMVRSQLNRSDTVLQLIISRAQRMVGIHYTAQEGYVPWTPSVVRASMRFWFRRYDIPAMLDLLKVLYWLFGISSLVHYLLECWAMHPESHFYLCNGDHLAWRLLTPVGLVTLASYSGPPSVIVMDPVMSVQDWTVVVAMTEIIMLARLFSEADVIPPCRVLLRALSIASRPAATLSLVLFIVMILLSGVAGQLFGPVLNHTWWTALLDFTDQMAHGAQLNGEAEWYAPVGSKVMYFLALIVLFLTMSQVFITILIDSFQAGREDRAEQQLAVHLPEGYSSVLRPCGLHEVVHSAVGWLSYYMPAYRSTSPQLLRALKRATTALVEADWSLEKHPILLSLEELAPFLHQAKIWEGAAEMLLLHFGAEWVGRSNSADTLESEGLSDDGNADNMPNVPATTTTNVGGRLAPTAPPPGAGVSEPGGRLCADSARAELVAETWELARRVEDPIPYSDLQTLSATTLRRMRQTLRVAAASQQRASPDKELDELEPSTAVEAER